MEEKVCTKCGKIKSISDFPKERNVCKACKAEYLKEYRKAHPEKIKKKSK